MPMMSWSRSSVQDLPVWIKVSEENKPVDVVIRPEDIDLVKPEEGIIQGTLTHSIFKGVHYEMEVTTNGFNGWFTARICSRSGPKSASKWIRSTSRS